MARPSMAAQRQQEILDAFERCIIRQGIAVTSLESIAEEASMKRSILRHYIGNRDAIVEALAMRWVERYRLQWQELQQHLSSTTPASSLVELFFYPRTPAEREAIAIGDALYAEAKHNSEVAKWMDVAMEEFIKECEGILARQYPAQPSQAYNEVASGLYAIYMTAESLIASGSPILGALQHSANRLINTLTT